MDSLVEILQDKSLVSLRMIDWFVTKYARKNGTYYNVDGKNFSVYTNYKSQLKAYSKKQPKIHVLKRRTNHRVQAFAPMLVLLNSTALLVQDFPP